MTKSGILLCFCLAFVSGIILDSLIKIPRLIWWGIFVLAFLLIILYLKSKVLALIGFCLLVLITGFWRHQIAVQLVELEELHQYYEQSMTLSGIVVDEPEQRINQQKFEFEAEEIPGRILITTELYPEYSYGDRLEINGQLKQPAQFEDFDYRQYLAKDKIYSVIYSSSVELLDHNQANWFYQRVFNFKARLRKSINRTLLPPQGSILKAIFLGDKWGLADNLKDKLNITGTRHIVAISGMHMIIMSQILLFLALAIGLWRGQAFYFVLFFLIIYILMIGAPASAIRAGLMASLLLLAQKVGRLRSAGRAVVLAATTMLAVNPLLLESDVGFQLSFLATLSIIYLKPILDEWMANWPNPARLKDILTMTLAAQLGTLPVLVFHFGRLSLISPLANLLIVPFLPLIMFSGIILSFSGLIWLTLAKVLAWPIWLLLTYLIKVIDCLSSFPLAAYQFKNISWIILLGYYSLLIIIINGCSKLRGLLT
jgi:competence protein ComEC